MKSSNFYDDDTNQGRKMIEIPEEGRESASADAQDATGKGGAVQERQDRQQDQPQSKGET